MKYSRLTVGDRGVCQTCIDLESEPEKTLEEWESSGLAPGIADTECGKKCRCSLVPATLDDIREEAMRLINEAADRAMSGISFDLLTGRRITLSEFDRYAGYVDQQLSWMARLEKKTYIWKKQTGGATLPPEWYQLADIRKMDAWLSEEIGYYVDDEYLFSDDYE